MGWGVTTSGDAPPDPIEDVASPAMAEVAEGNRRADEDRPHVSRIAAGAAEEAHTHLRVAEAWGYLTLSDLEPRASHLPSRWHRMFMGPIHRERGLRPRHVRKLAASATAGVRLANR